MFKNTVVKRVVVGGGNITRLVAVQRTPQAGVAWGGYDRLPSQDLADWYDERASARYDKQGIELASGYGRPAVFIDATDWGELLALAGASYVQGVESSEGATAADETCGQSIVFPFVEKLNAAPAADLRVPDATAQSKAFYSLSLAPGESAQASAYSVAKVGDRLRARLTPDLDRGCRPCRRAAAARLRARAPRPSRRPRASRRSTTRPRRPPSRRRLPGSTRPCRRR